MPNKDLLLATLAHIEAHPDEWFQERWRNQCGTSCCFAGTAALVDGADWCDDDPDSWRFDQVAKPGGNPVFVRNYAQDALGLTEDEACDLFLADNTLDDIRRLVAELCAAKEEEK